MANLSSKTGFTPVQTQVSIPTLNVATSVQDFAAYDAQVLTGFVYVDATADLRCSVSVTVVKNGAGTYEVASVDLAGDSYASAPLVAFSMSGSILRATLPAGIPGFASAYIKYQLNAPALGGNFPLTVSASQVQGGTATPLAGYVGETLVARPASAVTPGAAVSDLNKTVVSLSLSPGVWAVSGVAVLTPSTMTGLTFFYAGISTTNNAADSTNNNNIVGQDISASASITRYVPTPTRILNISATSTVYLVAGLQYSAIGTASFTTNSTIQAVRIA